MDRGQIEFSRRLRRLERRHGALSEGYETRLREDGLIVMRPRRARGRFPLRLLLFCAAAFVLFKGFFLFHLGPADYAGRVERLAGGSAVERAGAWLMRPEPLSEWIAAQMRAGLR